MTASRASAGQKTRNRQENAPIAPASMLSRTASILSRRASREADTEHPSSDASSASASSTHQSACTTTPSARADDFEQTPHINLARLRSMLELAKTACDPAKLAGGSSNLDDNFASRRNSLPAMGNGVGSTGLVGKVSRIQWICPLTADEWVDSGAGPATRECRENWSM